MPESRLEAAPTARIGADLWEGLPGPNRGWKPLLHQAANTQGR
jgi:hypothetical protein